MTIFSGADDKNAKKIRHTINIDELDFDDILKMGPKKGAQLVRNIVSQELNAEDMARRAYASTRMRQMKKCRVDDMLKFLEFKRRAQC